MNKCFVPPLNSQWKLLNPYQPADEILKNYSNETLTTGIGLDLTIRMWGGNTNVSHIDWVPDYHHWVRETIAHDPIVFPTGTIFQFNRYHFSNSGSQEATLEIISSPKKRFSPKKAGGTAKGKLRLYLNLAQLNDFPEIEPHVL